MDTMNGKTPGSGPSPALTRILYVEDDEDIQEIAKVALADIGGFEVDVCSSGMQALARVPDFKPDLILMDVMMPEMDGPTTLKALSGIEAARGIPVVFLTARAQPSDVRHYQMLGALGVITKPFRAATLADQLRDMWGAAQNGAGNDAG